MVVVHTSAAQSLFRESYGKYEDSLSLSQMDLDRYRPRPTPTLVVSVAPMNRTAWECHQGHRAEQLRAGTQRPRHGRRTGRVKGTHLTAPACPVAPVSDSVGPVHRTCSRDRTKSTGLRRPSSPTMSSPNATLPCTPPPTTQTHPSIRSDSRVCFYHSRCRTYVLHSCTLADAAEREQLWASAEEILNVHTYALCVVCRVSCVVCRVSC
jgi:hypothetical protein